MNEPVLNIIDLGEWDERLISSRSMEDLFCIAAQRKCWHRRGKGYAAVMIHVSPRAYARIMDLARTNEAMGAYCIGQYRLEFIVDGSMSNSWQMVREEPI